MIKVGVTGNIGSGKTYVCRIFETLGIPVYYADDRAKSLMNNDPILRKRLKYIFGPEVYLDDQLNRPYLSKIVFNNKNKLSQLNKIVHPAVALDGVQWFAQQKTPYAIKEAALIVETDGYKKLDALIVITAPEELRIQRVLDRDKTTRAQVLSRIKNQLSEKEKIRHATYVIVNDGEQMVIPQVYRIHTALSEIQ